MKTGYNLHFNSMVWQIVKMNRSNIVLQIKIENSQISESDTTPCKILRKRITPFLKKLNISSTRHSKIYSMDAKYDGSVVVEQDCELGPGSQCRTCDNFDPNSYK